MKKLLLLAVLGLFLFGCGASEMRRGASWQNWEHFKYSAWGYKNPSTEKGKMSEEQGWWGKEIPYIPAN